jgi:surface antigen
MRSRGISRLIWAAFFIGGLALSNKPTAAANCVLYVRAETGVALYGAAGGWWSEAEGRYARGQIPAVGAILVFKRTGHMRSGHVALVAKLVGPREILVDHANWYHGSVSRGVSVRDISPAGDWSRVAVMELHSGKHGRDNPTFGFIYPAEPSVSPAGFVDLLVHTESPDDRTPDTAWRGGLRSGRQAHAAWTAHAHSWENHTPTAD